MRKYLPSWIYRALANLKWIAAGNYITTIIQFVASIFIVRFLGAEDYGRWATAVAFVAFFSILTFPGVGSVLVREASHGFKEWKYAFEQLVPFRYIFIFSTILICILTSFFTPYDSEVKYIIIVLSFNLFIGQMGNTFKTGLSGGEKFKTIAIVNVITKISYVVPVLVLLYYGYGLMGILIASMASSLLCLLLFYNDVKKYVEVKFLSEIKFNKELLGQSFTYTAIQTIRTMATRVDVLVVSFLAAPIEVGYYALASRMNINFDLLRKVSGSSTYPMTVQRFRKGPVKKTFLLKYALFFFIIVFSASFIAGFYVKDLVVILFGEEFQTTGKLLEVLIFYQAFAWGYMPFTHATQATYNESVALYAGSLAAILNVPLNIIFYSMFGLIGVAYSTLCVYGISNSLGAVIIFRRLSRDGHLV